MAGSAPLDELIAYLARLLSAPVTADQPLPLRSVHRSALAAWSRRQGIAVRFNAITSSAPVTARQLLGDGAPLDQPAITAAVPPAVGATPAAGAPLLGLGIDIEGVDSLPLADDYRAHPFYQDNFTPAELSHCIRQADPRASLCGIWAAKEAIIKAGVLTVAPGRLAAIEITHDAAGRPERSGCQLSISHTATTAVAVCLALAAAPPAPPAVVPIATPPPAPVPAASPPRAFAWKVAAAIAGALAVGGLTLAAYAWT